MPYWKCFYHIVWATKHRQPLITPTHETILEAALENKCKELRCQLLGCNTVPDHLHIAMTIPPAKAIDFVIGQLKAASSRDVNLAFETSDRFEWQEGYGVFSFGEKVIPQVLQYIALQKEHHQNGTVWEYLERVEE